MAKVRQAQIEQLLKTAKEVVEDDSVSREEFLVAIKTITKFLTEWREGNKKEMEKMHGEMSASLTDIRAKAVTDSKKIVDSMLADVRKAMKDHQDGMNYLYDRVARLKDGEDGEPGRDADEDKIVSKLTEEFKLLLPEVKDNSDDIKRLENEIEELKKRPVSTGGGGVTNLRIQQAFKYILKTEEPVGDIDGVNKTYTLTQPIFAILSMSINGETIAQLPNYTITGRTFTFSTALPAAYSGKDFEVKYV